MRPTAENPTGPRPLPTAEFQVLLALLDEERHGHGIKRDVANRTAGRVVMGPGTLYGAIKRMLQRGLIEETDERPDPEMDDERRRYYRITAVGREAAAREAERMEQLLEIARAKRLTPTWKSA
jgi:DNA-binding PadR family transcriptional regulator